MKRAGVRVLQLDNGFRALLLERHNLPIVASVLWYQVGSRDEQVGETGLSHFLEHMMFKGTANYAKGEIDLLTSKMGGSNNAFTDHDSTAYYFSLASDRWHAALEIEADRMRSCLLDEEEFQAEKRVVLEELAMGEDDPWSTLFEAVETVAYQVHPYHHPVIGWRQDLQRLDVAQMRSYYQRSYGPNRAFLVVAGDIDAAETEDRIAELFADKPAAEPRRAVLDEPGKLAERRIVIRDPGKITRICVACRTCKMGQPDDFVLDLISAVLGSGKSSRIYDRLVTRERLATSVSVGNETRLDPGLFWVAAELCPGVTPAKVESVIREEMLKLVDKGPSAAELRRARMQIRSAYLFEEETVLDTALRIARFEALAEGGHKLLNKVLPIYEAQGARQIRNVARRYFAPESWAVAWSLPAGKGME